MYFLTGESVRRQITDSISKNLTNSDLKSGSNFANFGFAPQTRFLIYIVFYSSSI